ncbi:MAG: hypothetical protein KGK03_07400 [Candidatus Omnitrophica bacterium]|nr:hypothetical protein [Candidatus Omnitrophota bacterium]
MKTTLKIFFLLCCFSLLTIPSSYAYWRGHTHVWFSAGWPGPDYYYPYYPYYYPPAYYYPPDYVIDTSTFQPVVINGVTYYTNNGVYYTYGQYGYQAVAAPVGAPAAPATPQVTTASDDTITINIPNSKGGYTPVILKKSGKGFVGPQGEFYSEFPKVSQLQTMYGK